MSRPPAQPPDSNSDKAFPVETLGAGPYTLLITTETLTFRNAFAERGKPIPLNVIVIITALGAILGYVYTLDIRYIPLGAAITFTIGYGIKIAGRTRNMNRRDISISFSQITSIRLRKDARHYGIIKTEYLDARNAKQACEFRVAGNDYDRLKSTLSANSSLVSKLA